MAEPEEAQIPPIDSEEPEETPGYVPPAQVSVKDMLDKDKDDESLEKYKRTLLAGANPDEVPFPNDARHVIVQKLALVVPGRNDVELDLTGDLSVLKKKPFTIKEGCTYRMKIYFFVQREIVTGLKYHQVTYRRGIRVDKNSYMVGSYGPKLEAHEYLTPDDEAPKGMIARGSYTVKSKFVDDDKNVHLEWEWNLDIKKDWN